MKTLSTLQDAWATSAVIYYTSQMGALHWNPDDAAHSTSTGKASHHQRSNAWHGMQNLPPHIHFPEIWATTPSQGPGRYSSRSEQIPTLQSRATLELGRTAKSPQDASFCVTDHSVIMSKANSHAVEHALIRENRTAVTVLMHGPHPHSTLGSKPAWRSPPIEGHCTGYCPAAERVSA